MKLDKFRNDINGLRALAVIMVVLFHFNVPLLTSGFSGVDVFFVISGYLMTKIIVERLFKNSFSFFDFYMARAIRILPALIALCGGIYLLSLYVLIPEDLSYFSLYAIRSIFFLSNYYLMKETEGYFSPASHDNLLLHTWSLSVEWQFYVILPVILFLVYKAFNGRFLKQSILIIFVLSFALSICLKNNSSYAYYLFPSRAWEMIIGGIVFCFFNKKPNKNIFIYWVGLILILLSAIIFSEKNAWPYFGTLIPTIGTALVIHSRNENSFLSKNKLIQIIGSSSYSIYLWHWPIFVIFSYYQITSPVFSFFAILLSFAIGYFSFKLIEVPTKKWLSSHNKKTSFISIAFITLIVCLILKLTIIYDGFPSRAKSENYLAIEKEMQLPLPTNGWCFYSIDTLKNLSLGSEGLTCHIGSTDEGAKKVLLFGDSFAGQYIPFWNIIGKKENLNINAITTNWCYPSSGDDFNGRKESRAYAQCLFNRKYVLENLKNYDLIIFAGEWKRVMPYPVYKNGFEDMYNKAIANNKKIIVMSEPYAFDINIGKAYKRALWLNTDFDINKYKDGITHDIQKRSDKDLFDIISGNPNTMIIARDEMFSKSQYAIENIPYSWDGKHISILGSLSAENHFEKSGGLQKVKEFINK
ncbi:TPA: acyltransferase family protein [Klebsiella quasipneumoniae]